MLIATLAGVAATDSLAQTPPPRIRNVIVMISDGAGYNTLEATRLWTGKPLAVDDRRFFKAAMSVAPIRAGNDADPGPDGLKPHDNVAYKSSLAWDTRPAPADYKCPKAPQIAVGFAGYSWHCATYPDSANTMTAMMTGVLSYNNAINVDGRGTPVPSAPEAAVAVGRLAGFVTTAQVTDATPAAGGGAHAASRALRAEMSVELFGRGLLTVIGGAGNPDYDDEGQPDLSDKKCSSRDVPDRFEWIASPVWKDLKDGKSSIRVAPGWKLVQERSDIQAIADGRAEPPERLAMIAKAFCGIRQYRGGLKPGVQEPETGDVVEAQPTLPELTRAALARLEKGSGGLFLVVEESNTDRAAHANNLGRVIEARIAFEDAVREVVGWVEKNGGWKDTLLVITADHDHLLFGPDADIAGANPYQDVQPNPLGPGHLPLHKWFSNSHSNQLVPVFAYGADAKALIARAKLRDGHCDEQKRCFGRGRYLSNKDLGDFLVKSLQQTKKR